jgi:uncharacterized membrane protein YfcA
LVLEPLTLLGAIFGVYLNDTFPDVIITIFLVLVLGVSAWRTLLKAKQMYDKEKAGAKEAGERAPLVGQPPR